MGLIKLRVRPLKNPQTKAVLFYGIVDLYSRINREALLDSAQRNSQIPRGMLEQVFDAMIEEVENFVMNGHSVQLGELGVISCTLNSEGAATSDAVNGALVKRVKFHFRPSSKLRRMVNSVEFAVTKKN